MDGRELIPILAPTVKKRPRWGVNESRVVYKSFIWQFLAVGTSYLIAYLLKFIAINIIPLIKIPTFEKVPFFLDGLHIVF